MNELSTTLREEIAQLNIGAELTYMELATRLYIVSEEKLYSAWGYDTYAEYVKTELERSKTFASNMLKVGSFLTQNQIAPKEVPTSYARLAQAIRLHPTNPQLALAAATTLGEDELVHQAKEAKHGPHTPEWETKTTCKSCGVEDKYHA